MREKRFKDWNRLPRAKPSEVKSYMLTLANLLFQLYGLIAVEAASNLRRLHELHQDALLEASLARKRYAQFQTMNI